MDPINISDLGRKLDILCRMTSLGSRTALARHFGMTERGIDYWIKGDSARPPGLVPSVRYPALLELTQDLMPGLRTNAEVKQLLHGPLGSFREAFLANADGNWEAFLEMNGQAQGLEVVIGNVTAKTYRGPAELDLPPTEGLISIRRGDRFRLGIAPGFRTTATYWLTFLQYQEGLWSVLPIASKVSIAESRGKRVEVPNDEFASWYRISETARDRIRFVGIAVAQPFPENIRSCLAQKNVVEGGKLDVLAYHLANIDAAARHVALAECIVPTSQNTSIF